MFSLSLRNLISREFSFLYLRICVFLGVRVCMCLSVFHAVQPHKFTFYFVGGENYEAKKKSIYQQQTENTHDMMGKIQWKIRVKERKNNG